MDGSVTWKDRSLQKCNVYFLYHQSYLFANMKVLMAHLYINIKSFSLMFLSPPVIFLQVYLLV